MSIDYFENLEDFSLPDCSAYKTASDARDAIIESLAECEVELPTADMTEQELQASPPHVLFAWQYDYNMSLSLYAIPVSDLSEALAAAFVAADGCAYAYHELTLGDLQAQAFVRIDAAMGLPDYDEYIEGFAETIDKADIDCLSEYRVAFIEHEEEFVIEDEALDKRFVSAHTVRRTS